MKKPTVPWENFEIGMRKLSVAFDKQLAPELLGVYFEALASELTDAQWADVVRRAIAGCKWFPKVAELLDLSAERKQALLEVRERLAQEAARRYLLPARSPEEELEAMETLRKAARVEPLAAVRQMPPAPSPTVAVDRARYTDAEWAELQERDKAKREEARRRFAKGA